MSPQPVSEYNSEEYLFGKAFPWLFPSGFGDISFYNETKMNETQWGEMILHYQDGHFAMCKMWGFLH